jgi:thiamine pyrophosphate-dependent acetolactate synthase large subunit-like protein
MTIQNQLLTDLCIKNPKAVIISSLGTLSYDLSQIEHEKKILIRGAMGAAIGCGLGYALGAPDRKVIVCIGEGSLLMKLGSISTVMKHMPENLEIHVFNNGCYHSCGGQLNNFSTIRSLIPSFIHVHDLLPENTKEALASALPA